MMLCQFVKTGFPKKSSSLPPGQREFWKLRDDLSITDDLLMFQDRLVIPSKLRKDILKSLHASHQGIVRTKRRARSSVFWPGISADITNTVEACSKCQELRPSLQQETMRCDAPPTRPWRTPPRTSSPWMGKST